ncbi:hypothetical protein [Mesorhizobium caraganae]|uniref:hypothetical protein n=1 Tax=Mesorhizobium caraganae TaxID=483206 RepID=UPI00177C8F57|nr:hypothetical protein [Mesorhizobium caraganae]
MLVRWGQIVGLPAIPFNPAEPFADIFELRRQWFNAGGSLPVTEWDVLLVRPSGGDDVIAVGK